MVLITKATTALVLCATAASALRNQITFNNVVDELERAAADGSQQIKHTLDKAADWVSKSVRTFDNIIDNGITYELISHPEFPSYQIRMKESSDWCDSSSKSYSGYLDIDTDTHLFFVFFEARHKPSEAPVVLWLNGGPGCSSMTGLLFELGPCSIANEGKNTTYNKYSWTESANVIFIDSPVNVGYSYGGKSVNSSPETAEDLYAFLQLFYNKFPKFAKNDLHVTGESYAGTYIPNVGATIHKYNLAPATQNSVHIPLASLFIGNGLTDIATQFGTVPDYACDDDAKFGRIFDENTCAGLPGKISTCQRLAGYCYNSPNRFTCVGGTLSCWQVPGPIQQSGLNPYDVRRKCDREGKDGPLCYPEMQWIETYMNQADVKKALGVASDKTFQSCNMQINQAFTFNGDVAHNTAALIPPLLEAGIRVGIYAGEADFLCSWMGNEAWTLKLEWPRHDEFNKADNKKWKVDGKHVGDVRKVGKGAGDFAFIRVFEAGHMVPMDQPVAALDMLTKWIQNKALA
ncbi:hypothetical protein ACM66B_001493 [Microbotryomycetes sp. NB124-2]